MNEEKDLWFKRKTYGWGWTPATWQGWAVIAVFLILLGGLSFNIEETASEQEIVINYVLPLVVMVVALILIAYKTGEKPRWQWGNKDKK